MKKLLFLFLLFTHAALHADVHPDVKEVITLNDIGGNLSGITYNYDTDTYFLIQNNSGNIYEYDRTFKKPKRVITFKNLKHDDTEDIVYLGQNRFAISEEENVVLFVTILPDQREIDGSRFSKEVRRLRLPSPSRNNLGLEGICYNPGTSPASFYAVQEKRSKRIFHWAEGVEKIKEPFDSERLLKHVLSDLSSCTFHQRSNTLLLLSHESSRIMELSLDGIIHRTLDIPRIADQYEGLTLSPQNELILVSEPNILVVMHERYL